MRPNIIFFLIDGLRADQYFGKDKTSFTPNIDSLIQKGMYFTNSFTSVDGTIVSLNTIFNSHFQVGDSARYQKITLNENNLIDTLKKNGYHIYGTLPNFASFNALLEHFENKNTDLAENSEHSKGDPIDPIAAQFLGQKTVGSQSEFERYRATLPTGLAEKIIRLLKSKEKQEPYFCYFHVFDLHPLREGKKPIGTGDFDNEKFGAGLYERTVSVIDHELGKILEHVDLDNTILILTADHGERIPYDDQSAVDFQPKLETSKKIGLKILPKSTHKVGGQFLDKMRKSVGKRKLNKANEKLTNYQKRSRDPYFTLSLFDEMLHVPLLFVGNSIKPRIITKQVRHVDISPTIYELLDIQLDRKISGKSLISLDDERSQEENISYLHTMPYQKLTPSDMVGLRTSDYKYFRSAYNAKENVHLYDLKNDPYENNNIAETNKELVTQFEKKILQLEKDNFSQYDEKIPEKELQRISNELKRLGYM